MSYKITIYSKKKAKNLGLIVKLSTRKNKKIDVFKKEKGKLIKLASIGHVDYLDYPTYIKKKGLKYANERRRLYKIRHEKYRKIKNTPSYFADNILW
tara:strand:- start:1484 stop:1774 length:291 start_codon:yes stop_codon:yes gene_type:complete